jgi:tetratricopeptide (TPR) repeat protein
VLHIISRSSIELSAGGTRTTVSHGPIFQRWIACLVNADRRAEVLDAVSRLPAAEQELPIYLKARAEVYERAGDRAKALEFYDRYVAADPDDFDMALRRIQLLHKAGQRQLVLRSLDALPLPATTSPMNLMFVAQMRAEYGGLEESIRIGYRARRIGFNDPRIHQAYSGLILLRPSVQTKFLMLDRITRDVKVAVRHDAGGHVDLSDVQKVLYAVKERADQAAELVQRRSPPGGSPVVLPAREGGDRARRSRRHTSF